MSLGSSGYLREGGACAALSAAVCPQRLMRLSIISVTVLDMPMTPERVWRVINSAS